MAEPKRTELTVRRETALLLAVVTPMDRHIGLEPLEELRALVKTAGAHIVGEVVQHRANIHPGTYVGHGKAEELRDMAKSLDAAVIICDSDLTPAQIQDLEKITDTKVVDRSELILDIFATHARSKQARLQVELAQLEYTYPRLRHMWTHLSRYEGGIGTRGPGEQQLETDRRIVQRKITDLKKELKTIDRRRRMEAETRSEVFKVGIVGYTNAGKSTLMNALTGAGVLVEDKLFATLDTKTCRWDLDGRGEALLSDTVGFIRKLPHHLVASFKATLESAAYADLLLHVVDVSQSDALGQVEAVEGVLEEIGCGGKTTLPVFNKVDAVTDETALHILEERMPTGVRVSALRGTGLDRLKHAVLTEMQRDYRELRLRFSSANGRLAAYLYENGDVRERTDEDATTTMRVRMHARHVRRLSEQGELEIEILDAKGA